MHINEVLGANRIVFSFEFSPPKNERAADELFKTIAELMPLQPAYVSVTYGAGGSTRDLTRDLIIRIQRETKLTVVAHLTCVGSTRDEIRQILADYWDNGIRNIMALRGDPPKGQREFVQPAGGFAYASDLVAFVRQHFPEMGVGVAGFPEGIRARRIG